MTTKPILDLARVFPQEVHDSLRDLRRIAVEAKDHKDPLLRKATPDELALAETQRKPHHCVGHSQRTGLPCRVPKRTGMQVCRKHGGASGHVIKAAKARLEASVPTVMGALLNAATQTDNLNAAVKAQADWLDRANVGALVQAKVRQSKRDSNTGPQVIVNVGFLSQ